MQVAIIGAGVAGLTAAYGLRNADVSVTVFEQSNEHGQGDWWASGDFRYLTRRGLFGDSILSEAPLESKIKNHQFLLTDGRGYTGYDVDARSEQSESRFLFRRRQLVRWLRGNVQATDATIHTNTPVTSLIRRNNSVVGVRTGGENYPADIVLLSEGDSSRLVANEGYDRTLPSETHDFLTIAQESFSGDTRGIASHFQFKHESASNVVTLGIMPPAELPDVNLVGRFQIRDKGMSFDLMAPLEQLQESGANIRSLLSTIKSYPVLKPAFSNLSQESSTRGLIKDTGNGNLTNLVDHGLVVGGSATGAGGLFPVLRKFEAATAMGYQFARMTRQLSQKNSQPSRRSLDKFYETPLRKNPEFNQTAESVESRLYDKPGFMAKTIDLLFQDNSDILTDISNFILTNPKNNLKYFTNCLRYGLSLFNWKSPLLASPDSVRDLNSAGAPGTRSDSGATGRLLRFLMKWVLEDLLQSETSPRRSRADVFLDTLLEAVNQSTLTESGSGGLPSPDSGHCKNTSEPHRTELSGKSSVSLRVGGSLSPDGFGGSVALLCPVTVFRTEEGRLTEVRDEECIRCDYCHWASDRVDVRRKSGDFSDPPSQVEPPQSSVAVSDVFPVIPESEVRSAQHLYQCVTYIRRLNEQLRGLDHYVTPEEIDWYESLASLGRRCVDTYRDDLDADRSADSTVDELESVLRRIQRNLAAGRFSYAQNLSDQVLNVQLKNYQQSTSLRFSESSSYHSFVRAYRSHQSRSLGSADESTEPSVSQFQNLYECLLDCVLDGLDYGDTSDSKPDGVGWIRDDRLIVVSPELRPGSVAVLETTGRFEVTTPEVDRRRSHGGLNLLIGSPTGMPDSTTDYSDGEACFSSTQFTTDYLQIFRQLASSLIDDRSDNSPRRPDARQETTTLIYEPRVRMVVAGLTALRDFPDSLEITTRQLNRVKQTAARLLMVETDAVPSGVRTIDESVQTGWLKTLFLRLCPTDYVGHLDTIGQSGPRDDVINLLLSLTDEEETLWSDADRDGVLDDLVRQWRRMAGDCRQIISEVNHTSGFKGSLAIRLFIGRCFLNRTQTEIRLGKPARCTKQAADLWMRRTYEWKQTHEADAADYEPDSLSSPADRTGRNDPGMTEMKYRVDGSAELHKTLSDLRTNMLEWSEADDNGDMQEYRAIVREIDGLITRLNNWGDAHRSELQLVSIKGLSLLSRWVYHLRLEPVDKILPNGRAKITWFQGMLDSGRLAWLDTLNNDSFKTSLRRLRNRARDRWWNESHFDDEELIDRVERAFDRADASTLPYLTSRPNLFPWYRSFSRFLAELYHLGVGSRPEGDAHCEWRHRRSKRVIQRTASLVSHGLREAENNEDSAEGQIQDIIYPESIYRRRYSPLFEA